MTMTLPASGGPARQDFRRPGGRQCGGTATNASLGVVVGT